MGLATVNAFLEATAKVSTASATTAATASEASANDEVGAMRAIRDSTLALSVSRGADAPVDETSLLKSTSSRSVDAGDTGVRLAESRVEPGAPAAFHACEAGPERLDPDHTGRFETPPVVEFDAATRTLTVRGRVETEATLRDHPRASLARRVVFAEGVFSGFFPARDASLAVRASAGDPTRDATCASTRLLRWARSASPRATALEFRDRGTGTLAFVDAVARGGWRAESGRARNGAAAGPIRAPGLESLRVAPARGATSRGRRSVFFRSYAIHRFPTLQFVDDIAVTPEARARAAAAFAGLEDAAGGARREDEADSASAADGTPAYVDGVVAHASEMAEKLRALDACWDDIVRSYVAEGLGEGRAEERGRT